MGLLDMMNSDQGLLGLHLMAAAAPRERRVGFGEGLLTSLQGVQAQRADEEDRKARRQMQEMQMQQQQMQLAQMQAAQQREQGIDQAYRGALRTPEQAAMQKFGGPTVAAAQAAPGMAPQIDQGALLRGLMQADPRQAFQMLQPKPDEQIALSPGQVLYNKTKGQEVFRAPDKPAEAPADYRLWELSGAKERGIPFDEWSRANKRAGAARVEVPINLGQKGLDNTLKLRGDFRSEPIYKAHQETQSAYSQIQQALKQASPAGDLAGATKIMKLLDPGSVVRESELGMAMAASGALDRLQHYAGNVINGTKLTPTQRQDFQRLADALYGESVKQYNTKRGEYQGIAERNGLSVADVLGAPAAQLAPPAASAPTSGALSPAEQAELEQLRRRVGGKP